MAMDRNTRVLLFTFTLALLLNGLNPWLLPPVAGASEEIPAAGSEKTDKCTLAAENSSRDKKEIESLKRRLISMEGSLNDIKLTLSGIDRKINQLPSRYRKDSR